MEQKSTGGYLFLSNEDAILARGEEQKIAAVRQKMNFENPQAVLQVYQKAVENRVFLTPVGLDFLRELREYLLDNGAEEADLAPIPVLYRIANVQTEELIKSGSGTQRKNSNQKSHKKDYKKQTHTLAAACAILACGIVVMLYIAMSGNNPNVLNYRKAITNEYSAWEQELTEREAIVREKELELKLNHQ